MTTSPDITVVLCTFNRAEWLPGVIASLANQRTEGAFSYELLIVDNASVDGTPQVAASEMANANLPMRYVREETPGVSAARNRGIQEARGEWIAFCDDDQLADPRWLAELFDLARHKECRVVGGAVYLVRANENTDGASLENTVDEPLSSYLEDLLAPGGRSLSVKRFSRRDALNSGNQMVHRTVFEQIGVYNEGCREGGEDTDWFLRLIAAGREAWFTPTAVVRHLVPNYRLSVEYLRWVSFRQGWVLGRQQVEHLGLLPACLFGFARLVQIAVHHGPRLMMALATDDRDHALYRRCRTWRSLGFGRCLLRRLLPGVFPQQEFCSWIEFRGERSQFAPAPIPQAVSQSV